MRASLVTAWLPVKNRQITIDRDRLVYAAGYPSSLGPEHDRLQLSVWISDTTAEARLEAAIVSDSVSHLVIDAPGKTHYETLSAEYGYVTAPHKEHELHHVLYVWRLVRDRDGKVLYDSLTSSESWRTCSSNNTPLDWGNAVRAARNAGELTQVRERSFWSWP